jgi:NAD(P)-dependent dehydrogenase (short-subunit alcohol dehydrogenase family)
VRGASHGDWGARTRHLRQRRQPGPVETPLYDKLSIPDAYREQVNKDITATIPFGLFGTPEEVAKAVLYLASDGFRWTVGSEVIVNGVRTLSG